MSKTVAVLGAGVFGTSIATLLAENDYEVNLWCYEQDVVEQILKNNENESFLPGIKLSSKISATSSLQEAFRKSLWIFEAVPVLFLRNILNKSKVFVTKNHKFVILSKGIEKDTLLLPSGIIDDVFGYNAKKAVVAGPNFATEIAEKHFTAAVVASDDKNIVKELQDMLLNSYFRTYLSDDLIGVQVGGAIKNVLCLLIGIAKGNLCAENTIAFLLTKGLEEISKIAVCLGGKKETVFGLSGFGDLILSSLGSRGRNLKAGEIIGQTSSLKEVENKLGVLPEGINTVQSINALIKKCNLDLPICQGAYDIIFNGKSFSNFLNDLI